MDIKLRALASLLTVMLVIAINSSVAHAANSSVFQITNTPYQETHSLIYGNMVVYTTFGGVGGIDIWGYDLETKTNFPIIEKTGQQWVDHLYKNWLVYEDFDGSSQTYDIRLYNLKTKKDELITPGSSSYSSGSTNGKEIVFLDGGACGQLMVYTIKTKVTKKLADDVCIPKVSNRFVIWSGREPSGPGIYGYDLIKDEYIEVNTGEGFADTIDIYKNKVVWMTYTGSRYRIMIKNLVNGKVRTLLDTTDYYVNYPAVSERYVVWGKSLVADTAGVEGIDLKTDQIFEIYPQGPHQNTNLAPAIWKNIAVWGAWRTGNGDIYGSILN